MAELRRDARLPTVRKGVQTEIREGVKVSARGKEPMEKPCEDTPIRSFAGPAGEA
jgi:hypothetical protein